MPGSVFSTHSAGSAPAAGTGTGTGTGTRAGTGTGTGGSTGATTGTDTASPGAGVVDQAQGVDEFGNVIAAGGTGSSTVGGAAVSSPFALPSANSGWVIWVMVGAAVLFLAIVALPPVLSRRLRSPDRPRP